MVDDVVTASAPSRKLAELSAKLASLRAELAQWRGESEAGRPLEKHHSQIRRITGRLDVLADLVGAELVRVSIDDLVGHWQEIELALLDVHHVWDFFRAKFATRYAPELRDVLVTADELTWSCYAPAQRKAVAAGSITAVDVREPPLTFFGSDSSPLALSRHATYVQRGRAQDLYTTLFADELRSLPVPVTAVPWHLAGHLPDMMLLAHETGHQVEDDFGLTPHLRAVARKRLVAEQTPDARVEFWMARLGEVFADVYGVLGTGSAYVAALIDFLAAPAAAIAEERAPADYPTTHLRVQVSLATLRSSCPDDPRAAVLTDGWWSVHPAHALAACDADVQTLVDALLTGPYPPFGSVPLTAVLSFEPLRYETEVDAARLAEPLQPQSSDPRALLAAATLVFTEHPDVYQERRVAEQTLRRIREVQSTGTRFRSQVADRPVLVEADRVAATRLHERLAELRHLTRRSSVTG